MTNVGPLSPFESLRASLHRRQFLRAAGLGLGASALPVGVGAARPGGASNSQPYGDVVAVPGARVSHATVDPGDLPTPVIPNDPNILNEGEGKAVPRGTPNGGAKSAAIPSPSVGTTGTGLTVERSFDGFTTRDVVRGIDFNDDGVIESDEIFFAIPSDNQVAAGPDHLVTVINSELGIIDKSVPQDGADRAGGGNDANDYLTHYRLEDFFYGVLSLSPDDEDDDGDGLPDALQFENIEVFDPRVRFDPGSGRYLVACSEFNLPDTKVVNGETVAIDDPNDYHGAYLLAVSTSDDPSDPWDIYRVAPERNVGLVDYPTLGYDAAAVYLSHNYFAMPNLAFQGASMTVLDKGDLMAGRNTPTGWEFTGLTNPEGSLAFTLQPAAMPGTSDGAHLANSRYGDGQTLTVWDVTGQADLSSAPGLENWSVRVAPYANAPAAEQAGTNKKVDTLDTRLLNLAYDASTGTLWSALTTASGYVRWFELDPADRALGQSGSYRVANQSTFLPTLEAENGAMVLVYNVGAEQQYVGVEVAGRTTGFDAGELQDHQLVQAGQTAYNYDRTKGDIGPGAEENVLRWGDYNGAAVDPDDGSFWVIGQYAKDSLPNEAGPAVSELYGTRIANVAFED